MDNNYWKNAYKDTWDAFAKREEFMIDWIRNNTGLEAVPIGLGAGSDEFIDGSAAENGLDKGDADLHIVNTNIYVEVTGPLSDKVSVYSPLWFRPDKFNNAVRNARKGHDTFFAHHCPSKDLWRVIHIDNELIQRLFNQEFNIVHPIIRGRQETYVEIPAKDRCVKTIDFLQQYLNTKFK